MVRHRFETQVYRIFFPFSVIGTISDRSLILALSSPRGSIAYTPMVVKNDLRLLIKSRINDHSFYELQVGV